MLWEEKWVLKKATLYVKLKITSPDYCRAFEKHDYQISD